MKKGILGVTGILGVIFLILVVFHIRYPFWVYSDEVWSIGYSLSEDPIKKIDLDKSTIISHRSIDSLTISKTRFIADPFLIIEEGGFYIFFEHQGEGDADIGLLYSPDGEKFQFQGIILDEPFHLSFPQVFYYQGDYYMLPETKQTNNVLLYKADKFPFEWNIVDTLIHDRKLEDPALLLSEDLNLIAASEINSLTQYFFTSDSLRGEWKEHRLFKKRRGNETRAGGRFLQVNEDWYLPLQNNSKGYGTGLSLYKLITSKEELYLKEVSDLHLGPAPSIRWFATGMHHLDVEEIGKKYFVVYDGKMRNSNQKINNYRASIKYNFHDLKNFLFGK